MSEKPSAPQGIRRFKIGLNVLLQLIAAVLLLVVANVLSFRHYMRWDLTLGQDYTLADQTRTFLKGLHGRTDLIAVFPRGTEEGKEIRSLLDEYKRQGKSHIGIDTLDPVREPSRRIEMENRYGLPLNQNGLLVVRDPSATSKPKTDEAPKPPAAVVPTPGAAPAPKFRTRFIPAEQLFGYEDRQGQPPRLKEFRGENMLTSGLVAVNQKTTPTVYLIGNMGELPGAEVPGGRITAYSVLMRLAEAQGFTIAPLMLVGLEEIPEDAAALISLRPQRDFTSREIDLLKAYWDRKKGAALLVMLDPATDTPRLDAFLGENGIKPRNDRVLIAASTPKGPRKVYEVPSIFGPQSPITEKFRDTVLTVPEQSKSLAMEEDPARLRAGSLETAALIAARGDYWGETDYYNDQKLPTRDEGEIGAPNPVILAASAEKGAQKDQRLGAFSARLVVVGNAALIDPDRDTKAVSDIGYDFISSSINWLLNREDLIGIAPKLKNSFHLNISGDAVRHTFWLCVAALPGIVLVFAGAVWSARRA